MKKRMTILNMLSHNKKNKNKSNNMNDHAELAPMNSILITAPNTTQVQENQTRT